MKHSDLEKVQALNGEVAVSIFAPTHTRSPENQQDPIVLKNLVTKAEELLLTLGDKRDMAAVLENLAAAFNQINFANTTAGIALLASERGFQVFKLSHSPEENVHVGESFFLAELVKTISKSWEYHMLVLSESPTRLFRGDRDELTEILGNFPLEHTGRGGNEGLPTGYGQRTSVVEDEEHRKFFRQVSQALAKVQAHETLPLIVTGVTRFQAFWADVAPTQLAELTIEGSYDFMSEAELMDKCWEEIEQFFRAKSHGVVADLDSAKSQKLYAGGLTEVSELATAQRIQTLVVSEDEITNKEVEKVLQLVLGAGGEAYFVPGKLLADFAPVAARLRF